MKPRVFVVAFVMFAVAAALGAAFALVGPIALIRIFGTIAFLGGAAGCALQLYALHAFAPRAYALLIRKFRHRYYNVADTLPSPRRTVLAAYR